MEEIRCSITIEIRNLVSSGGGDGDRWHEGVYYSTKEQVGEHRIHFQSHKTGRKSLGEPPTGASKVFHLKGSRH
jgi:hypothetical protein